MKDSLESLLTRAISIASKFLLVGFLAKELSLNDYGGFQLVSYFVLISTTVFGLELYNLTNRAIPKTRNQINIYEEHLSFFCTTFPVVVVFQIILFLLLFPIELITLTNVALVFVVGLCDYFSQEVYRYLMINKSFRKGNLQLIYKGLFFVGFLFLYNFFFGSLSFREVLWIMGFSYFLLFIFALHSFRNTLYSFKKDSFSLLSKTKLYHNLKSVAPFLVLIVFLKGIEFSDKFIISKKLGLEETGVYSFLFAVASAIHIFVVSGFYIIYLPKLIKLHSFKSGSFGKELLTFGAITFVSSVILVFIVPLISPFIFEIIGKSEFSSQTSLLYFLLVGFMLNNLSLIP
ncbi:MAG: hypothetical protein AAGL34_17800, partial [Bacteroidota bacterium]